MPVVIDNPILNAPFEEPRKHFQFGDEGITNEVVDERRRSSYFIPIACPRSRSTGQKAFETEWTKERIEENQFINRIRERVEIWRRGGYQGITPTTRRFLESQALSADPEDHARMAESVRHASRSHLHPDAAAD